MPCGDPERDLISIVIPSRDEGERLRRTLEGILAENFYPNFEVVVVDDASVEPVVWDDPRVRIFRFDEGRGEMAARKWGVEQARGDILQFVDAHVRVAPGWLANLYEALRRRDFRALVGPVVATLDEESWSFSGEVSYGWCGAERHYGSRHLNRRETGPDGEVPAFSNHSFMVSRVMHEEIGGFCEWFAGQGSFEVEYCRRASSFGYRSYLESSSLIGHMYKGSYAEPVTWEQMAYHNLLIRYIQSGEEGLPEARRSCEQRPGHEEGWRRFMAVKDRVSPYRWALPASPRLPPATVTVVIAAHNEGKSVRATVESVMQQHASVEFALVDDGSDDGSFDFLQHPPFRCDTRIRTVRFDESVGCVRARHEGVLLAGSDSILFLDAHMALFPDAVEVMSAALRRAGPLGVIVPDVAILDADTWQIGPSTGQLFSINERLDFVWNQEALPGPLAAVGGGCCVLMSRALYHQVGGFDLGLRRWGSEFTDLILKVYNAGGLCYLEPDVRVGHLFRTVFPYTMTHGAVAYNKLRTAYVHFSPEVFARFQSLTYEDPGMDEARAGGEHDREDWESRRLAQLSQARRHPDWYPAMFLPSLIVG